METKNTQLSNPLRQSFASDALMPIDSRTRDFARSLYSLVGDLPIISPHGHVDPEMLLANKPFSNPADLFIYNDHYVTRLLHADGVEYAKVRAPKDFTEQHAREAWRELANRWHLFAGTASGYWLKYEFESLFGFSNLSAKNSDSTFDSISAALQTEKMRPLELFQDFGITFLATTDSPTDSLNPHRELNKLGLGRIAPTFRPDAFFAVLSHGWKQRVELICEQTHQSLTQDGFVEALAIRRAYFKESGGVSIDIGAATAFTTILSDQEASRLFEKALAGTISEGEALQFRGHMIAESIRQSCEDGLVVTLHVGVHRNHSSATFDKFGPDTGHDIPTSAEFVENLKPVLEKYGLHPNLNLILFSLDESTWGREIAPLASFYPSVYVGAPWWFLDAPFAASRFREATVETAGFYRGSGFIDDTRAFLSIPARHDMARRVDSSFLAELVVRGQLSLDAAERIAVDLVTSVPRRAFKI